MDDHRDETEPAASEDESSAGAAPRPPAARGFRAKPLLVVAVALALIAAWQVQRRNERFREMDAKSGVKTGLPVQVIVVDKSGEEIRYPPVPWQEGMTVLQVMQAMQERDAQFNFEFKGEGEAAMLTQIDEFTNEGGGAGAHNWLYYVNGELATQSFALQKVNGGDVILWKFAAAE